MATQNGINSEGRKYQRCEECGLDIRCGDKEKHEKGHNHKTRMYNLGKQKKTY